MLFRLCLWSLCGAVAAAAATADDGHSSARRTPVVAAVQDVLPAVVNIGTERVVSLTYTDPGEQQRGGAFDDILRDLLEAGPAPDRTVHSLGSGVLVDPAGWIITNAHVVERAAIIQVTLYDGRTLPARFVAGDPVSDLALIKIEAPGPPLPAIRFGRDNDLLLGETVIALGNPFGLASSVSVGVLSAMNREASYNGQVLYRDILQTDAAVNPGNSGGPLVNLDGELIGINVAIQREAQNIGFAVPAARARALLAVWFAPRVANRLDTGFEARETEGRVRIASVAPAGPAAGANLAAGDIVLAVNGRPTPTLLDYHRAWLPVRAGEDATLDLQRGELMVRATVRPQALPKPSGPQLARDRLGLELSEAPPAGRVRKGLEVTRVPAGGPAAALGLQPGFLLTRINGVNIQAPDDVGRALEDVRPGDPVTLALARVEERGALVLMSVFTANLKAGGAPAEAAP